jgi:hypothetical protein
VTTRQQKKWLARKASRRDLPETYLQRQIKNLREAGTLKTTLRNFSRHPKGQPRERDPQYN